MDEAPIRLYLWDLGQCNPNYCTGRKLVRLHKVKELQKKDRFHGIVLSPASDTVISQSDTEVAEKRGLCVIDCSWNQIDKVPAKLLYSKNHRRLPLLTAVNSNHYGKFRELSCVEAYAAALCILEHVEEAADLLGPFSWGSTFFSVNQEYLTTYAEVGVDRRAMLTAEADFQNDISQNKSNKLTYGEVYETIEKELEESSDTDLDNVEKTETAVSDDVTSE